MAIKNGINIKKIFLLYFNLFQTGVSNPRYHHQFLPFELFSKT